ncbi:MAG: HDOD domain-containing protein [Thermodesulfobacteriota bacterium]|nr:HDOD domain-containing protein [Thermodesulfobacteriota bacterium]
METFMARQPIFDRDKKIFAYELLFRDGMANFFPDIDGSSATSRILSSTFFTSDIDQITGGKRAFINFTGDLILREIPLMFPHQVTTVEILEDIQVDEQIIRACTKLKDQGYCIALDDFQYHPGLDPLIAMADIIKLDLRISPPEEIREYIDRFNATGVKFLAEKVETIEEFQQYTEMGCSYFQGYFFSRPQIMKNRDIPSLKINMLQVMTEVNSDQFRVDRLKEMIERDVGISYKLLKYLNSPFFRRTNDISSIKQAIVMLGENGIRRFLSVIILSELSEDKSSEVLKNSIVRAKFCEQLGAIKKTQREASRFFTLGLFSLIDVILENTMDHILDNLPLAKDIKDTLMHRETQMTPLLKLTIDYEKGNWKDVIETADDMGVDITPFPSLYSEAIGWADALIED